MLFLFHSIFVVQCFLFTHFVLSCQEAFLDSFHTSNRSLVLPRSTYWQWWPIIEISGRIMPLLCLGPHLSFGHEIGKRCAKTVEYPFFKSKPSRRGVGMESKILPVEDIVPSTVIEVIWWKFVNKNYFWAPRLVLDDKRKIRQVVWSI